MTEIQAYTAILLEEVMQMEKKLYKVFYRTVNGMEEHTFIEADGEEK